MARWQALLAEGGVDVLICGGIGGGAQTALAEAGVKPLRWCQRGADAARAGTFGRRLAYNPKVQCNHHGEGHGHGEAGHSRGTPWRRTEHSRGGHGGRKQPLSVSKKFLKIATNMILVFIIVKLF